MSYDSGIAGFDAQGTQPDGTSVRISVPLQPTLYDGPRQPYNHATEIASPPANRRYRPKANRMSTRDSSFEPSIFAPSDPPSCADFPSVLGDGMLLNDDSAQVDASIVRRNVGEIPDEALLASIFHVGAPLSAEGSVEVKRETQPRLPNAGERVMGLHLIRELGRGAFARVFLAHEIGLANRPVAAKISFARRDESHTLAQLQHSHIVPIYSAHLDPATGLRVLIMPYFGGTTLDRLLAKAGPKATHYPTGRGLLTALDHLSLVDDGEPQSLATPVSGNWSRRTSQSVNSTESLVQSPATRSLRQRLFTRAVFAKNRLPANSENAARPARSLLDRSSYIEAVTWIAARLAEGLSHAHQRGIVHRDIKPSNVLIASDGQPMLLDFNLARDLKSNDAGAVAYVGGTLPYMAPEHLDAFNTQNPTPAAAVDERSDIFSLGVVLFEMLSNKRPYPMENPQGPLAATLMKMAAQRRVPPPSARESNPIVPRSLDAIVRRCMQPDPTERYQTAANLAEDLQCELDNLPLRNTRDPSVTERAKKWMRRHPKMSSGGSIATLSILLITGLMYLVVIIGGRLASYDAERRWIKFQEGLVRAQLLVHTANEPGENSHEGALVCEQTLGLFDILRDRRWLSSSRVSHLDPAARRRLPEDAIELAILLARTRVDQAKRIRASREQDHLVREAVDLLELAEHFETRRIPRALFEDRSNYRLQLGDRVGADADLGRAQLIEVQTARDHYLRGTALAAERKFDAAIQELKAALLLEPKHFWARFQLGICLYELGRFRQAADIYSVCEALWLECAWANFNRGLAYGRMDALQEAIDDYTAAIRKDPKFADAFLNRGLAYLKLHNYDRALADLARALDLHCHSPAAAWSARATALAARGELDEAKANYDAALRINPGDIGILLSRGFAFARSEPERSLQDFDAVLRTDAQSAAAHYGRAYVLSNRDGQLGSAIEAARMATQIDPNHLGARCTLAVLLARSESYQDAIDQITLAIRQSDTAVVRYSAACVYALASRMDSQYAERSFDSLELALEQNYNRQAFRDDPDLIPIQHSPQFETICAKYSQQ